MQGGDRGADACFNRCHKTRRRHEPVSHWFHIVRYANIYVRFLYRYRLGLVYKFRNSEQKFKPEYYKWQLSKHLDFLASVLQFTQNRMPTCGRH